MAKQRNGRRSAERGEAAAAPRELAAVSREELVAAQARVAAGPFRHERGFETGGGIGERVAKGTRGAKLRGRRELRHARRHREAVAHQGGILAATEKTQRPVVDACAKRQARDGRSEGALGDPQRPPGVGEHGHDEAIGRVENDAAPGRELRGGHRHHGLELRTHARLLARRADWEVLDAQKDDAGHKRGHGREACRLAPPLNRNNIRVK